MPLFPRAKAGGLTSVYPYIGAPRRGALSALTVSPCGVFAVILILNTSYNKGFNINDFRLFP